MTKQELFDMAKAKYDKIKNNKNYICSPDYIDFKLTDDINVSIRKGVIKEITIKYGDIIESIKPRDNL